MAALTYDVSRRVRAGGAQVRDEVARAFDELGFHVTTSQVTLVEARKGSRYAPVLGPSKLPVEASVTIDVGSEGCGVGIHLQDGLHSPIGKTYGVNTSYQQLFAHVCERIDAGLARLDPEAVTGVTTGAFASTTPDLGAFEAVNTKLGTATEAAGATVVAKVGEVVSGSAAAGVPSAWRDIERVRLQCAGGTAVLPLAEAQAHLSVAAMVALQPGSLPPNLAAQLERFAADVEQALSASVGTDVVVEVAEGDIPVFEFLHQQVRIRDGLPVRTLHRCRDCLFEKVTNPDYQALLRRNQRLRAITGMLGLTVRGGAVSPFILVGALFQLRRSDPDYVCPRCQGMEADESYCTFCPTCGDLRKEAALRRCPKCSFDFRTRLEPEVLWLHEVPALAVVPAATAADGVTVGAPPPPSCLRPEQVPVGPTPLGVSGGKVCRICGQEFPQLWRIVVDPGTGPEEWFVCSSNEGCRPQSLVAPVPA